MTANNPPQLPGHAIGFQLFNTDDQSVIYLNQTPEGHLLHCQVDNVSDRNIEIAAAEKGKLPSGDDYHFALRFRRGLLQTRKEGGFTITATDLPSGWAASEATLGNDGVSIYFLYTAVDPEATAGANPLPTKALIPLHDSLVFSLSDAQATLRSGARSTQVELLFQDLNYEGEQGNPLHGSRLHLLNVINHMGHRMAPLLFSWVGSHRLLNNGAAHILHLRVLNTQRTQALQFADDEDAPTRMVFTSGSEVVKITNVNLATPALSGGGKLDENEGKWTFTASKVGLANIGQDSWLEFELTIAPGTVSDHYLVHLRYENLPGFWDNSVALPIEVSPIALKDSNVGINTSTPEATLHVAGKPTDSNGKTLVIGDTTEGLNSNLRLGYHKDYSWIQSHGQKPLYINPIPSWVRVGGSSHPTAPLDVTGNINSSGKVKESGHDLMPSGGIIMWSGKSIPKGWVLCDAGESLKTGSEEANIVKQKQLKIPDLRDKFIVGSGKSHKTNDTGGTPSHQHAVNIPQHKTKKDGEHWHVVKVPEMLAVVKEGQGRNKAALAPYAGTTTITTPSQTLFTEEKDRIDRNKLIREDLHQHAIPEQRASSSTENHLPPFYALAFIMKL